MDDTSIDGQTSELFIKKTVTGLELEEFVSLVKTEISVEVTVLCQDLLYYMVRIITFVFMLNSGFQPLKGGYRGSEG